MSEALADAAHHVSHVSLAAEEEGSCALDLPCVRAAVEFLAEAIPIVRLASPEAARELAEQLALIVFEWLKRLDLDYVEGMAYYSSLKALGPADAVAKLGPEKVAELVELIGAPRCDREAVADALYATLDAVGASDEALSYFARLMATASCEALKRAVALVLFTSPTGPDG